MRGESHLVKRRGKSKDSGRKIKAEAKCRNRTRKFQRDRNRKEGGENGSTTDFPVKGNQLREKERRHEQRGGGVTEIRDRESVWVHPKYRTDLVAPGKNYTEK